MKSFTEFRSQIQQDIEEGYVPPERNRPDVSADDKAKLGKVADLMAKEKAKKDLPFTPDKPQKPVAKAGKYGSGYSTARHLARQGLKDVQKEEVVEEEQLDEISTAAKQNYINAAALDVARHGNMLGRAQVGKSKTVASISGGKIDKRLQGIATATSKLAKEDTEQIDELDKKTLGSYIKKASSQAVTAGIVGTSMGAGHTPKANQPEPGSKQYALMRKREAGVRTAVDKLTKEETEMSQMDKYLAAISGNADFRTGLEEKKLTPAEMKKREEIAKAMERENPGMPMDKKMAIATATAKKVAEEAEEIDEISTAAKQNYINAAALDVARQGNMLGRAQVGKSKTAASISGSKIDKRLKGIATATSKLTKEETEGMHYCAKHVYSERFGEGFVVEGSHAEPDENGLIEWYDVDFGGTVRRVMTEKVKVMHAEYHNNHKRKMSEEDKPHTIPKTKKEKDLAALAEPKDKITHADVMVGRGVKKEELSSTEKMKRGLYNKEEAELEEAKSCMKEENPTGIKIYHTTKEGKPTHGIVFTPHDARTYEKEVKSSGGKVTHRAVMYGKTEGEKVAVKEGVEFTEGMISYGDFMDKIAMHRKMGNKVVDDKYSDKHATYTSIDKEGVGRKVTHTASGQKMENLGKINGDDDEAAEVKTEKRGRGRPAGTKSGARRHS